MTELSNSPVSSIVTVSGLIKQFGRFAALRGVTAEFSGGRLYAVLGDNGAGKTTLLRSFVGLAKPTRGSVSVLGTTDLRGVSAQIGYMAHPSLLYDEMSAMENLRYFSRLYGMNDAGRCAQVISGVGLDPSLARPVGQYSQGMRQRLSLARALLNRPKVLLLDEPFSNVDARSAREMAGLLAGLRDAGHTLFVVTHQAGLLETVADEFVFMEAGQIAGRDHELGGAAQPRQNAAQRASPGSEVENRQAPEGRKRSKSVGLGAVAAATLAKDLRLEWRSKDAINSMLFFALLVVVIFSFSFNPTAEESREIAGGLVWVAFLFAAVVALNQTWGRELKNQVLDAFRVSPAPANALFLAKAVGNFIFVGVLGALMTPLFIVFYSLRALGPAYQLFIVAAFGMWALVVNGTFFAAMSLRTRAREIMLPLLLFPISIPALLGMVEATRAILVGEAAKFWIVLLGTYDVLFTIACLFLFETVLDAE